MYEFIVLYIHIVSLFQKQEIQNTTVVIVCETNSQLLFPGSEADKRSIRIITIMGFFFAFASEESLNISLRVTITLF